jgi:predicted O-methyltransferase YrrM
VSNQVLDAIYATKTVTNGTATFSALSRDGLPTYVDLQEGDLLRRVVSAVRPTQSVEVGLAYGVSTMHICEALSQLGAQARHIVLDPLQFSKYQGVGLHNLRTTGLDRFVTFFEEPSETALPRLLAAGTRIQFAFVDGLHTFEQCALELYYIDRMLDPGGAIVFDDVSWRPINKVLRMALSYSNYEVCDRLHSPKQPSLLGSIRRAVVRVPPLRAMLHPAVAARDWDLGIDGSCVALRKVSAGTRPNGWYVDF